MRKTHWILKRLILFLAVFTVGIFSFANPVCAVSAGNIYDHAGLLNEDEIRLLAESITSFMEDSGWNVYAVTTDDAQGKSAMAYADDFFDAHSPEQEDGVALLIDMDNREIWISTCGIAIRYLTDTRIDRILDDAYAYVSVGDYLGCLDAMLSGIRTAYEDGIPAGQYNYDEETGEISKYRNITHVEAIIAFAAALFTGVVVFCGIVGSYRLKLGTYRYDPHRYGKVSLQRSEDRFVNQTVTHHRIQSSGGHSGGSRSSSTHRSSSGRSHGGGGRRF